MFITVRRKRIKKKIARIFMRVAVVLTALYFLIAVQLPSQLRGYAYEIYREGAKMQMNIQYRGLNVVEGDYVRVKFQEGDRRFASIVLEASEKFYKPIDEKYGLQTGDKITVIIYHRREELNASFDWPASENAMGAYWAGVIRVVSPCAWIEESDHDRMREIFVRYGPMAHELTHMAVDYITRGNCPRWLTEGLAQLEEYRLAGFQNRPDMPDSVFYSLADMDGHFDELPDQRSAYYESFSVVEYIESVYGEDKLQEILYRLGDGKRIEDAILLVLGKDMETLEQNWRTWSGF